MDRVVSGMGHESPPRSTLDRVRRAVRCALWHHHLYTRRHGSTRCRGHPDNGGVSPRAGRDGRTNDRRAKPGVFIARAVTGRFPPLLTTADRMSISTPDRVELCWRQFTTTAIHSPSASLDHAQTTRRHHRAPKPPPRDRRVESGGGKPPRGCCHLGHSFERSQQVFLLSTRTVSITFL